MIVSGKIVKGLQEGRKLGYPTINLDYSLDFGLNSESGLNKKLAHHLNHVKKKIVYLQYYFFYGIACSSF